MTDATLEDAIQDDPYVLLALTEEAFYPPDAMPLAARRDALRNAYESQGVGDLASPMIEGVVAGTNDLWRQATTQLLAR